MARIVPIRNFFLLPANYKACRSPLVQRFGELMRKLWNPRNFKGQVCASQPPGRRSGQTLDFAAGAGLQPGAFSSHAQPTLLAQPFDAVFQQVRGELLQGPGVCLLSVLVPLSSFTAS